MEQHLKKVGKVIPQEDWPTLKNNQKHKPISTPQASEFRYKSSSLNINSVTLSRILISRQLYRYQSNHCCFRCNSVTPNSMLGG